MWPRLLHFAPLALGNAGCLDMKRVGQLLWTILAAIIVPAAIHGQTGTTQGTRGRTDPVQRELQRRFESEAIEQALAEGPRHRDGSERRRILAQIKEDFLRIQIINDELRKFRTSGSVLDLEAISKSAGQIAKLARRLKDNLALPQIESIAEFSEPMAESETEQVRRSLSVLSNSINAFVENPLFAKAGVVDAQLSLKALRDLQQVIGVSKQLKTTSEQLKKAELRVMQFRSPRN